MHITTILPLSRIKYLDRVIESLMNQTYKSQRLLVIFDGPDSEYIEARNKIVGLDFENVLFVKSNNPKVALSIPDRRRHIVNIHNQFRGLIGETDWIFSIEDDGILPKDALQRLVNIVKQKDTVGMVTGVELGRWGVPYVGAWRVDDIHEVKQIYSIQNKTKEDPTVVEEIDACGLYCALIDAGQYKDHEFYTHNGLGPDVNLGIYLRQKGLENYIDWGIPITHLTLRHGYETEISATDNSSTVRMTLLRNGMWAVSR